MDVIAAKNGGRAYTKTAKLTLVGALLGMLVALPLPVGAQGWWWGSRINPGFDRKTVIHVTGTVIEFNTVDRGGPSMLRLQASDEIFDVVLAPGWFLFEAQADLKSGDKLLVKGSRVADRKGKIYLIAARVTNWRTGHTLELRDELGRPLWGPRRDR